jgi:antitoxin ParD1/3/4
VIRAHEGASQTDCFVVWSFMTIRLTPSQEEWIRDRVASGAFASVEDAARQLIDDRIAEIRLLENDDMAWAKPFVDEAREAVARGDILTGLARPFGSLRAGASRRVASSDAPQDEGDR